MSVQGKLTIPILSEIVLSRVNTYDVTMFTKFDDITKELKVFLEIFLRDTLKTLCYDRKVEHTRLNTVKTNISLTSLLGRKHTKILYIKFTLEKTKER